MGPARWILIVIRRFCDGVGPRMVWKVGEDDFHTRRGQAAMQPRPTLKRSAFASGQVALQSRAQFVVWASAQNYGDQGRTGWYYPFAVGSAV